MKNSDTGDGQPIPDGNSDSPELDVCGQSFILFSQLYAEQLEIQCEDSVVKEFHWKGHKQITPIYMHRKIGVHLLQMSCTREDERVTQSIYKLP